MTRAPSSRVGLVLASTLLAASSASAVERVAVLEFSSDPPNVVSPAALRLFSDEARRATVTELPTERYFVITREAQATIFENFNVKEAEFCDAAANCEVKAAQLIRARYLFTGNVTKIGSMLTLTIKLFDADAGRVLYIEKIDGDDDAALYRGTFDAAKSLIQKGIRASAGGPVADERAIGGGESSFSVADVEETLFEFRSDPPGALVRVDGMLLCTQTPCKRAVPKRSVRVAMEKENYLPVEERVNVREGAAVNLRLVPNFAMLSVETSPPGLPVQVNGRPVSIPRGGLMLTPGTYDVTVENSCFIKTGQKVTIDRGVDRTVRLEPPPHMAALRVRAILDDTEEVVADVYVDGMKMGSSMKTHRVPACARDLRVVGPDHVERLEYSTVLSLRPNAQNDVTARFTTMAVREKRERERLEKERIATEAERQRLATEAERQRLAYEAEQRRIAEEDRRYREEQDRLRYEEQRAAQEAQAEADRVAHKESVLLGRINWWSNLALTAGMVVGGGALVLASLTFSGGPVNIITGILGSAPPLPTFQVTGNDTLDTVAGTVLLVGGGTLLVLGVVMFIASDFNLPPPFMGWCTESTTKCCAPVAPDACL